MRDFNGSEETSMAIVRSKQLCMLENVQSGQLLQTEAELAVDVTSTFSI